MGSITTGSHVLVRGVHVTARTRLPGGETMRLNSLVVLAVLALTACDRDKSGKTGTTTTTGAGVERPATVEEVRMVMLADRPDQTAAINALQITNVDGVVTLRGHVDDEQAKKALVERVKKMPGVKDELAVVPARLKIEPPPGQPGQQGQPRPQGQPKGGSK
jgi:hypothetical protein